MKEYDYISENFLNRVSLAMLGLTHISKGELLSLSPFHSALFELVYAAAVTGVEEYLKYRLYKEVFSSEKSGRSYVSKYNEHNKNPKRKIHVKFPLNEEDREIIEDSIQTKQICHRIDQIFDIFDYISGTDFKDNECDSAKDIYTIVNTRHLILHNGGRNNMGDRIKFSAYDVNQAVETARKFIGEVEARFVSLGKERIIVEPTEE